MDRGAWVATVHGVAKSRTQLSDFTLIIDSGNGDFRQYLYIHPYMTPNSQINKTSVF